MKVYIVTLKRNYEDTEILGVFTRLSKAEVFEEKHSENSKHMDVYSIYEEVVQ